MTPAHMVRRHHHPARSKNVVALLALLLSTLLLLLAARIAHAEPADLSMARVFDRSAALARDVVRSTETAEASRP